MAIATGVGALIDFLIPEEAQAPDLFEEQKEAMERGIPVDEVVAARAALPPATISGALIDTKKADLIKRQSTMPDAPVKSGTPQRRVLNPEVIGEPIKRGPRISDIDDAIFTAAKKADDPLLITSKVIPEKSAASVGKKVLSGVGKAAKTGFKVGKYSLIAGGILTAAYTIMNLLGGRKDEEITEEKVSKFFQDDPQGKTIADYLTEPFKMRDKDDKEIERIFNVRVKRVKEALGEDIRRRK